MEVFVLYKDCQFPPLHTESIIANQELEHRKELPMPTEEELEQIITEHIDREDVTDIQPQKRSDE